MAVKPDSNHRLLATTITHPCRTRNTVKLSISKAICSFTRVMCSAQMMIELSLSLTSILVIISSLVMNAVLFSSFYEVWCDS